MSPGKLKKFLAKDPAFRAEMDSCLEHMEKMPALRAKVFN